MTASGRLVAIVDDDPGVCRALDRLLRSMGFDVATYPTGEALLAGARGRPPDDVLLDYHLPGLHGAKLIAEVRHLHQNARIVMMTGLDRPGLRQACLAAGAIACIGKPIHRTALETLLGLPEPDRDS